MIDEKFIRKRITKLRMQKDVSEYKMSLDMGHSGSYINSIASGKAMPSMGEFLIYARLSRGLPCPSFSTRKLKRRSKLPRLTKFCGNSTRVT